MSDQLSHEYLELRKQGPFPNTIDPWAETRRYFKPIHEGMIGYLLEQIQDPLDQLGYRAGRETSLQIAEKREPDVYVEDMKAARVLPPQSFDYSVAAAEILAEPGVAIGAEIVEFDGIFIWEQGSSVLVTVVEIISPTNKDNQEQIAEYRQRRQRLVRKGVNVVEIDLTRSVKRLVEDKLASAYSYHVSIHLPNQPARLVGMDWGEQLKRIALPLQAEVVPMDLHGAYRQAYEVNRTASRLNSETTYGANHLPFPSLLTPAQRHEALATVEAWKKRLAELR